MIVRRGALLLLALGVFSLTQAAAVISGFVRDAESGEFLPDVNVYLEDGSAGTATNKYGFYVLPKIPAGSYTLIASMIGYAEIKREVALDADTRMRQDFELEMGSIEMPAVEVTARRYRFEHQVDIGVRELPIHKLEQIPGFVERDLFRSLQLLPSVITISDFTSALYIRGGTMDQNLVLLDGVTMYNPYHLSGFFSTFIVESLKGAELYTGGYPARYGGALSAVLDVQMKDGNSKQIGLWGEIGLLTSKLVAEGPLPFGWKGSWMVAGRRTYIDAVTWTLDKIFARPIERSGIGSIYLPYHFLDLQAKLNWDATERSRLTLSGFYGDDVLSFKDIMDNLDFRWGNAIFGLQWRYLFTPQLFSILGANITRYRVDLDVAWEDTVENESFFERVRSGIGEISTRWQFTWFPTDAHQVDWGIEAKVVETVNSFEDQDTMWQNKRDTFWSASLYVQDKWKPSPWWVIEAGVRGTYFSNGNYWRATPRLAVKWRPTANWALTAGAGLYDQYIYIPYPRDEMMLKVPIQFFQQWIPADSAYPPLHSAMATVGTQYMLPWDIDASIELYYKDIRNLRESEGFFDEGPILDTFKVKIGQGYSWGAEILLKRKTAWVGYSLAMTQYKFGDDGEWFCPAQDSRHNVNISFAVPLGKGWDATSSWMFSSGFPYTGPIGYYQVVDEFGNISWQPIFGDRNTTRYPPYHRLDVGVTKQFKLFKRFDAEFYLQVVNAYARRNVLFYSYDVNPTAGTFEREPIYMLPVPIPSFGFRVSFL